MRSLLVIFSFVALSSHAQERTIVYCLPGQGSDRRIFDSLVFDHRYDIRFIEYGTPPADASMASFARDLAARIDTTKEFILLGVSLGGMIHCFSVSLSSVI